MRFPFSKRLIQMALLLIILMLCRSCFHTLQSSDTDVYNRQDYRHWVDEDKNGLDTRQEVLIQESLIPVTMSENGRKVVAGLWVDPYTAATNTNPAALDIDHLIPLKNAHESGAKKWNKNKKMAFANNLKNSNHLIAVPKGQNRQKSDKAPHRWLPPNKAYQCTYIKNWVEIKKEWGLAVEPETLQMWSNCIGTKAHQH